MPAKKKYFTEEERKEAKREKGRIWRENNRSKLLDQKKEYYYNNKERLNKISNLYYIENKEKCNEYSRKYHHENKERLNKSRRDYHSKHRNESLQKFKLYYINNKDKIKKYRKAYRITNWENIKKKHNIWCRNKRSLRREKEKGYQKKYINKNPYYLLQKSIRRRDKIKLNTHTTYISKNYISYIKNKFNYKCFKCGSIDKLALDHHYPLHMGYPLSENNTVLLCKSCNSSKSNKLPEDFYSREQLKELEEVYGIKKNENVSTQLYLFPDTRSGNNHGIRVR